MKIISITVTGHSAVLWAVARGPTSKGTPY